jgi:hypothetical protein
VTVCGLSAERQTQLDQLLAGDPGWANGLRPLLAGEFGIEARDLLLRSLSQRLAAGPSMRTALLLALANAMRIARSERDDA